jgi:hypothetical protein
MTMHVSHSGWEYPPWRDFYLRLARSFRLILFDKRSSREYPAVGNSSRSRRQRTNEIAAVDNGAEARWESLPTSGALQTKPGGAVVRGS